MLFNDLLVDLIIARKNRNNPSFNHKSLIEGIAFDARIRRDRDLVHDIYFTKVGAASIINIHFPINLGHTFKIRRD